MRFNRIIIIIYLTIIYSLFVKNVNAQDSWSQVDGPYGGTINDIHITSNGYIFISTNNGVYRSTNNGQNWALKDSGIYSSSIKVITGNLNDELYVGSLGGAIYKSTNYGNSWTEVNQGMTNSSINAINIGDNNFIYAANGGFPGDVFLSDDNGNSWQNIGEGLTFGIKDITINDSGWVYVISDWSGVFRTKNNGQIWETINDSLENDNISAIAIMENGLLLLGVGTDLYASGNSGDYWEKMIDNLSTWPISTIYVDSLDQIYLGTLNGEVFFSSDSGYTWGLLNENFDLEEITCLSVREDGAVFVGTSPTGVLRTYDNGSTWEYINQDIVNYFCTSLLVDSLNRIYFGAYQGIFRSSPDGTNWEAINSGLYPGMNGYEIIALSQTIAGDIYAASHVGIYVFNEENTIWEYLTDLECSSLLITYNSYIIVGTYLSGIYRSVDGGENWENVYTNAGSPITDIGDFTQNSLGHIFAGTNRGILKSIDNGQTWELINTEVIASGSQSLSCSANDILYAGIYGQGVYRSEDYGYTWSQISDGFSNTNITSLVSNSDSQTYLGIWGSNAGVFQISDNLDSWSRINTGLFNTNVNALILDNDEFLYAGTRDGFLFKSNETTTAIEPNSQLYPINYKFEQNYPNPFNPTTTIQYELPQRSDVQITIYDLIGRKVTTLVSETQEAGLKTVTWNATNDNGNPVSAGVYLYQIRARLRSASYDGQAGKFVQTKKMVLLK